MRDYVKPGMLMFLLMTLTGCSVIAAYQKCGFGGCPGDAIITADVRSSFRQYPAIEPPNLIDIQTINHVVFLYGSVDTEVQRQLAEAVALNVKGVTKVVNTLGTRNGSF